MIINRNGSILPVTVVAMLIMTIVGLICTQMFMMQNIMATSDQVKLRTSYAAEGAIEMLRGYIDNNFSVTNSSFDTSEFASTSTTKNYIDIYINGNGGSYDYTIYPKVYARATCGRVATQSAIAGFPVTELSGNEYRWYYITSIASSTVNSRVIVSTVEYYFYTLHSTTYSNTIYERYFRGWREL